ncbi:hypothetical protein CLG85_020975 [Yangia mangrovi]|uniref:Alginate biosynthesis protein n=1 Tax=Alloyangia mangrovi TaxID=1779329 RepID=A0A2A3JT29_9RHOB|nr:alginate biosynthesis protein [Alloyangia mangrovi]MCT4372642.1 hypothetical protein [Alloyangia mangrovi]
MSGLSKGVLLATALIAATGIPALAGESAYGCTGLERNRDLPSIEGRDGVFFRINADLRMNHPFSQGVVDGLAQLSRALERRGTTLIFVAIPTKSVSMPDYLPPEAALYGFDLEVATEVHLDIQRRLAAAGVVTTDIREALLNAEPGQLPFFGTDFHWSAYGADLGARAIADVIRAQPAYSALAKTEHETVRIGHEPSFSGMRRILQALCTETLPEPETDTFETTVAQLDLVPEKDVGGMLDLFGTETETLDIALVGTSFSDSPINNFPGFIAQHSDLEVVNYAITGGNQFGAITSYLTSEEFEEAPPVFLVWENPIYNNLAQYGDQPMRELIAAASGNCTTRIASEVSQDRRLLHADLGGLGLGPADTLFLDTNGSTALEVEFRFRSAAGSERKKVLHRSERMRRSGRFYMPLSGLWPEGADGIEISLSAPLGGDPALYTCTTPSEDKS